MNNNTTTNNNKRTKMKKIAVLLFVYLICHNGFYYVLMRNSDTLKFASDTAFRGFKCGADSVLFTITGSAVECAATCWNDLACSSMVRYPETHQCTGCTSFIGENDPEQSSSVFYKRGYNYIGCYKDCPRVMEKKDYIKMSGMTTEYCINRCLSKDFAYSNTEVGLECFCGSSIDFTAAQKMPEADCESECTRRCKSDMWGSLPWFALSDWSIGIS